MEDNCFALFVTETFQSRGRVGQFCDAQERECLETACGLYERLEVETPVEIAQHGRDVGHAMGNVGGRGGRTGHK